MVATVVGLQGALAGKRFKVGSESITFGRSDENDVVLTNLLTSRVHAELRHEDGGYLLHDRGSSNGTWVNGRRVTVHRLQPGDEIVIGGEAFRFETPASVPVLRVTVTGGGPVGLSFALLLDHLMGPRVSIKVYDARWLRNGDQVVWKTAEQGNVRRQQVVTIQSRQFLKLPPEVQECLFVPGAYSEMWPKGPDSIQDLGPRNVRIAHVEDQLLAVANERPGQIQLIPDRFDPAAGDLAGQHVLAICEGSRSRTLEHFAGKFGACDSSMYALDGTQVQDLVLGLRVKSELPDPMAVLLTVAQNRFLLNSLRGEGFLNMRLTDQEAREAVGIDPVRRVFTECIQAQPCVLELRAGREFYCAGHHALFLPALLQGSGLWARVQEGLQLFGVPPENLSAVTGFRLDMVQRPRFTAQLYPRTATAPGSRYLERAEHTTRLMDVDLQLGLDQSPESTTGRWLRLIEALRVPASLTGNTDGASLAHTLTFSRMNPSSIVSCVASARENLRHVREQCSSEMWEQLNRLDLQMLGTAACAHPRQAPYRFWSRSRR